MLAILIKLDIYLLLSTNTLKCHQDMWLSPSIDKLLYFLMTFLNSSLENGGHSDMDFIGILSSKCDLIWQSWTKLSIFDKVLTKNLQV